MPERNTNFEEVVDRKNTDCLKFDFAVRRGRPEDVLPLWVADMDFRTSSYILDKIQERVAHGIFGYTETADAYFKAVASWFKRHHDMDIKSEEWIIKTPGVVFALAMAVKAYTHEGDAILIQRPVYYPLTEVIEDNNRVVVSNDLVLDENGKYQIDFDDFEKKVVENHVRLFFLCSPHNPVGRVWTREELTRLSEIILKYNLIVVSDEIHEDFTFEGHTHTPFINIDERLLDHVITCTSPGKTFNLAGLQISNIIIPNVNIRAAFKKQVDAAGYSQVGTMGIIACQAAYENGDEWVIELKKYLQSNLEFVKEYVKNELPEIRLIEPEGTYLVWLDFSGLGLCRNGLEDLIVNKAKLWLDSGVIFGKTGEGFQRINIATRKEVLEEALKRIKLAIAN